MVQAQRVEIPRWLERILRIPGGGICLLIVLLPFTLLLVLLLVILYVLCIPVRTSHIDSCLTAAGSRLPAHKSHFCHPPAVTQVRRIRALLDVYGLWRLPL